MPQRLLLQSGTPVRPLETAAQTKLSAGQDTRRRSAEKDFGCEKKLLLKFQSQTVFRVPPRCQGVGWVGEETLADEPIPRIWARLRRNSLSSHKDLSTPKWQEKRQAAARKLFKGERILNIGFIVSSEHETERPGKVKVLWFTPKETELDFLHRQPLLCHWYPLHQLLCALHKNNNNLLRFWLLLSLQLLFPHWMLLCRRRIFSEGHWVLQKISKYSRPVGGRLSL